MSSFFTLPIEFISHAPGDIVSFISSSRPFLNCSIVPCILSNKNTKDLSFASHFNGYMQTGTLWQKLIDEDDDLNWYRFFILSDTLQFSSIMSIPHYSNSTLFTQKILTPLIRDNPYFTRTLKHFRDFTIEKIKLLPEIKSLEALILNDNVITSSCSKYLKQLPLRKLEMICYEFPESEDFESEKIKMAKDFLSDLSSSQDSVTKNTHSV